MPTLGGGGAGEGGHGLRAAARGPRFFGISSRGNRFAYIVDRSGSMGQARKMPTAIRELEQSLQALPDYA